MIAAGFVLVLLDEGYRPHAWYPVAALLAAATTATLVAVRAFRVSGRPARIALAAYAAFVLWSYASIAWAAAPGDALTGANRTLLYGLALVAAGLAARAPRAAAAAHGLLTLCASGTAAGLLILMATSDLPESFLSFGRLSEPTGYPNATASWFGMAFWSAVHVVRASGVRWPLRALALGCACLLLQVAFLAQSRGAAGGFVVAAFVYLALTPRRAGAVLVVAVAVLGLAASWMPLTAVAAAQGHEALEAAVAGACAAIAISFCGAVVIGAAAVRFTGWEAARWRTDTGRAGRRHRVAAICAVVAVATIAVAWSAGGLRDWTADRWRDFRTGDYVEVEQGSSRLEGSLASNRYDFYRVAFDQLRSQPLAGIGADNFAAAYLVHRRSHEAPRNPHGLAVQHLVQLGVVGGLLFLVFLAAAAVQAVRVRTAAGPRDADCRAAAAAGFVAWLVHAQVDYLWDFPALGLTAFALLGIACAPAAVRPTGEQGGGDRVVERRSRRGRIVVAVTGSVVAAALGLCAVGERLAAAGYATVERDPRGALERFEAAARWSALSSEPPLARGVVGRALGLRSLARQALHEALHREPENWLAHLELALVEIEMGSRPRALPHARDAARLNPRLRGVHALGERIREGRAIDVAAIDHRLRHYPAHRDSIVLERLYRSATITPGQA